MKDWIRATTHRTDLAALAAIAVAAVAVGIPGGIVGLGIVWGAGLALHAAGIVLVYRSNRIVNFAAVPAGTAAALLFRLLVEQNTLVRGLRAICAPCVPRGGGAIETAAYWVALALSLAAAVGLSLLVYLFVVRRFADAPRLVATVATVGVAQLLASVQVAMPGLLATAEQKQLGRVPVGIAAPPPLDVSFRWSPAVFRAQDVLTVVVAAAGIAALVVFLRRGRRGIEARAAAENPNRASTLRIDVEASMARVWAIAGALSGAAALLLAMNEQAGERLPMNVGLTVRILAAAVVARMTSVSVAAVAAIVLGLFDQAMLWELGSVSVVDGMFAGIVVVVLLLQRARGTRAEEQLAAGWRAAREARPVPRELRALPAVRRWTRAAAIAGVLAVLAFPVVASPTQTNVWTITLIHGIVGLSLLVLSGWAGQISLGQFALAAVGAVVASSVAGAGLPLAMVLGAMAGAAAATLAGLPALRLPGLHLAITTLAGALATSAILLSPDRLGARLAAEIDRGSLVGVDLDDHRAFYYLTLVVLGLVVVGVVGLRRSRFGRALIASRDNDAAARAFGVDPVRLRLAAFAISGALAGLAGALFAFHQHGVKAASFTPSVSVLMFLMAVIGGLGSVAGPLLGAAFLGVLSLAAAGRLVLFLATGGGVLLLLLVMPGGLAGFAYGLRDAFLRRVARRQGIDVPALLGERVAREGRRAPIAQKPGAAGLPAFVPVRYRLEERR